MWMSLYCKLDGFHLLMPVDCETLVQMLVFLSVKYHIQHTLNHFHLKSSAKLGPQGRVLLLWPREATHNCSFGPFFGPKHTVRNA